MTTVPFGTVTIGRISFREDWLVQQDNQGVLALAGQDTSVKNTLSGVTWLGDELMALQQTVVPIVFTSKSSLNGFYLIGQVQVNENRYEDNNGLTVAVIDWTVAATRIGIASEVLVESRMVGNGRKTDFNTLTPQKWHAPAIGAVSYYTGPTIPGYLDRVGSAGAVRAFLAVPQNPQWSIDPTGYFKGSAALTVASKVRSGLAVPNTPTDWSLDNTLFRISAGVGASHTFEASCWNGSAWTPNKNIYVKVGSTTFDTPVNMTVLRNDAEHVILRLEYDLNPGRTFIDIGLRRGSRFAEFYVQTSTSSSIFLGVNTAEAGTSITGALTAAANDANGQRYVMGSAHTFTANTVSGNISVATVTSMDAFFGFQVGGGAAVAGDLAADLVNQYLGLQAQSTRLVRR